MHLRTKIVLDGQKQIFAYFGEIHYLEGKMGIVL